MSWLALLVAATLATPCWAPPVAAPVERTFDEPACPWCPGHRGLRYRTVVGTPVLAPTSGRVTFTGAVAGRSWVTVTTTDGRRITLGPLRSTGVAVGAAVVAGRSVGRSGDHVLLTVRTPPGPDERYLDPEPLLGRWTGRPRLVPTDGRPAPPTPTDRRLRCPVPPGVTAPGSG